MPLDIAVGILLSLGVAEFFGVEATPLLIAFGVASALLPDIDILTLPLLKKWHHRTYTHYPIMYVPLVALAAFLLPAHYVALLALTVYAHLVHDTFGTGWGIAWFWPFSHKRFLFFPEKSRGIAGMLAVWEPQDQPQPENLAGEREWIRQYYFRPGTVAYVEYGALIFSLMVLGLYFS